MGEKQHRTNKVALITGSAKGLGKMTALTLAAAGCDIVINYRNSETEAKALAEQIAATGVRCGTVRADVSRTDELRQMAAYVEEEFGGADILINNAGPFIRDRRLFHDYSLEEIEEMIHGNLLGAITLDHLVLPSMRRKRWGRIIHFGFGRAGEARGWPHRAAYAAAKVGLVSFTKTLAVEEAEHGITVNMICPGDIRGAHKERTIDEVAHMADKEAPRGRPGSGEDVARVITFLCEDKSDFVTGNIIDVSGGLDPIRNLPLR